MAQSIESILLEECMKIITQWATEFEWKDLSGAVVMDVGCGYDFSCSKALVEQFPKVKAVIAVDVNSDVFSKEKLIDERITFYHGNILQRDSLKVYEGKMDKVLSTNTIQQISDKELAFQNVYRLLKPGGEAAFSFCVDSYMNKFLRVFLEIPKFKDMYKGSFTKEKFPEGRGKEFYKEMLESIGFKNVRSREDMEFEPFFSDGDFKDSLFDLIKDDFIIPPGDEQTFKDKAAEIYEKTIDKYDGQLGYYFVGLDLLGVKPLESTDSLESTKAEGMPDN